MRLQKQTFLNLERFRAHRIDKYSKESERHAHNVDRISSKLIKEAEINITESITDNFIYPCLNHWYFLDDVAFPRDTRSYDESAEGSNCGNYL